MPKTKKEIIKKFNNISTELLTDMKKIIGGSYLTKYKMMIRMNSTYPIKRFKMNVLKFKDFIIDKNPEYFKNENIILNVVENNEEYKLEKEYYMNEYYSLRQIYNNIDDSSKENLWDILKVLIFLCESYHNN